MMRRLAWGLGLVAVGCLLVGADALAGKVVAFGHGHADEVDAVDLGDLLDGETRIFGAGEDQITATRAGDVVTLSRGASGDHRVIDITCRVPQDSCKVMTFDDDGEERVMIAIEKRRECVNGEGDCEDIEAMMLMDGAIGAKRMMFLHTGEDCAADAGECVVEIETLDGGPHADHLKLLISDEDGDDEGLTWMSAHGPKVFRFGSSDQLSLRCPEGDTTMSVGKDEADQIFLCPKHSVALEPQPLRRVIRRKIELRDDDVH